MGSWIKISIHAPRTGRDATQTTKSFKSAEFQSTRPVRGATQTIWMSRSFASYFNPRAPYGARHTRRYSITQRQAISIHAPRTGRDPNQTALIDKEDNFNPRAPYGARPGWRRGAAGMLHFNPRAPYGARLARGLEMQLPKRISIHAPRTGRDRFRVIRTRLRSNFNPRAPYGARPEKLT